MIYLDNAATSFPKPAQVPEAAAGVMTRLGGNPGRAGHRISLCGGRIITQCRREISEYLFMEEPEQLIFTYSCTDGLNLAIRGSLHCGDHVICSHGEHNAVMRVLEGLRRAGDITLTKLRPDRTGVISPQILQEAMTPRTALAVIAHADNVTGTVQPVARLGMVCQENGVPLLVDAAQTAGVLDVSPAHLHAAMVAMPGHKGLLGPHGTGLLALGKGVRPEPWREGGTGSQSESVYQPEEAPERYESGTLNLPGIAGLMAGARFVRRHQTEIAEYEDYLASFLYQELHAIPGVVVYGHPDAKRLGIVSFNIAGMDGGAVADALDRKGLALRSGLHCNPSIHEWLGSLQTGAIRASVGIYNTQQDIVALLDAVYDLAMERR